MNSDAIPAVAIFALAIFLGIRSTFRLWIDYREISEHLRPMSRSIGFAFVVVSGTITAAAVILGALATRTLLGFERLEYGAIITYGIAIAIFAIPPFLEHVWSRIR